MLYKKIELEKSFFFKIGTCLKYATIAELPNVLLELWQKKYNQYYSVLNPSLAEEDVYSEVGKYITELSTISEVAFGVISVENKKYTYEVDTIVGTEKHILKTLATNMEMVVGSTLAGYNIINYQLPFLVKKMLTNRIKLPFLLQLRNKKPWEINVIDLMRDYQGNMFGDIEESVVLNAFGIDSLDSDPIKDQLGKTIELAIAMST